MDTSTDERLSDVERYGEEVLNANWLPQDVLRPEQEDETCATSSASEDDAIGDPDSFMRRLYQAQE